MAVPVQIQVDIRRWTAGIKAIGKQVTYATMNAINDIAFESRRNVIGEMQRVFDRPTPYTLRGVEVIKATREKLRARVFVSQDPNKGIPRANFLGPQVYGGDRNVKRMESALRKAQVLPPGMFAIPGSAAQLDRYGNMSRGQIVQIISWFDAFPEVGYRANQGDKGREKRKQFKVIGGKTPRTQLGLRYFVLKKRRGRLAAGIYRATSGPSKWSKPQLVIAFARKPTYRQRLDYQRVVKSTHDRLYAPVFQIRLRQALATAR
jgi:hypothetical protein